jgi:hypothetical protein
VLLDDESRMHTEHEVVADRHVVRGAGKPSALAIQDDLVRIERVDHTEDGGVLSNGLSG